MSEKITDEYVEGSPGGSWGGTTHAVRADYDRPNHGDGRDRVHWAKARCGAEVIVHNPTRPWSPMRTAQGHALTGCKRCDHLIRRDDTAAAAARRLNSPGRREDQALYGVTYRDEGGKARHARVWAADADEAARHVASHVVGFASLERVIIPRQNPFKDPAAT